MKETAGLVAFAFAFGTAASPSPSPEGHGAVTFGPTLLIGIVVLGLVLFFVRRRFQRAAEMFEPGLGREERRGEPKGEPAEERPLEGRPPKGGPLRRPWEKAPPNGSGGKSGAGN